MGGNPVPRAIVKCYFHDNFIDIFPLKHEDRVTLWELGHSAITEKTGFWSEIQRQCLL